MTGEPCFVEIQHVFPSARPDCVVADVERVARAGLDAAGIRLRASHTEVRLTPGGPAIVEINPRPAGGMIPRLVELARGIDVLEQQLRVAVGKAPDLRATGAGHAGIRFLIAPYDGRFEEVTGVSEARALEGVVDVAVTGRPRASVRRARDAYDRVGYVIARGNSQDVVARTLAAAHEVLAVRVTAESGCGRVASVSPWPFGRRSAHPPAQLPGGAR